MKGGTTLPIVIGTNDTVIGRIHFVEPVDNLFEAACIFLGGDGRSQLALHFEQRCRGQPVAATVRLLCRRDGIMDFCTVEFKPRR